MKVWKFRLDPPTEGHVTTVEMPAGAVVLSVAAIGLGLFVWAVCDPTRPPEARTFRVVATGVEFEWSGSFLGTAIMGDMVWHVWQT